MLAVLLNSCLQSFPPLWGCSVATGVSGSELKALDSLCTRGGLIKCALKPEDVYSRKELEFLMTGDVQLGSLQRGNRAAGKADTVGWGGYQQQLERVLTDYCCSIPSHDFLWKTQFG